MPDALALRHVLCFGTGRHLLGLPGFYMRQAVCPKSCVSGRKLRISNCSPESQKKEKVSPPRLVLDEFYKPVRLALDVWVMGVSSRMFSRQVPLSGIQAYILPQTSGRTYVSSRMPFSSRISEYVLKMPSGWQDCSIKPDVCENAIRLAGLQHKTRCVCQINF